MSIRGGTFGHTYVLGSPTSKVYFFFASLAISKFNALLFINFNSIFLFLLFRMRSIKLKWWLVTSGVIAIEFNSKFVNSTNEKLNEYYT